MAEKCQKCPRRDKCDHKRREACAYYDEPVESSAAISAGVNAALPATRETVQINVGGVLTTVYKDEVEKQLYEVFQRQFMLYCGT